MEFCWVSVLEIPAYVAIFSRQVRSKKKLLQREFQYWYLNGLNLIAVVCSLTYYGDLRILLALTGHISFVGFHSPFGVIVGRKHVNLITGHVQ